jgi:hypothetical protein
MLIGRGDAAAGQDRAKMLGAMTADLEKTRQWLNTRRNVRWLGVPYRGTIESPADWARRISGFLDGGLAEDAMVAVVTPSLYRHRI